MTKCWYSGIDLVKMLVVESRIGIQKAGNILSTRGLFSFLFTLIKDDRQLQDNVVSASALVNNSLGDYPVFMKLLIREMLKGYGKFKSNHDLMKMFERFKNRAIIRGGFKQGRDHWDDPKWIARDIQAIKMKLPHLLPKNVDYYFAEYCDDFYRKAA